MSRLSKINKHSTLRKVERFVAEVKRARHRKKHPAPVAKEMRGVSLRS